MGVSEKASIHLSGLRFSFGGKKIFSDLSLSVEEGEIAVLLGRNGSGKSTILNLITGLLRAEQGTIYYRGLALHLMKTHQIALLGIGYLMQGGVVFPHLTVEQNLVFAESRGRSTKPNPSSDAVSLAYPILASLMKQRAGLLSGGERQALAISMVVAQNPTVLLLDEPVAGLSSELSIATAHLISSLCKESKCLAIIAEHNYVFAKSLGATCYELFSKDGAVSTIRASPRSSGG